MPWFADSLRTFVCFWMLLRKIFGEKEGKKQVFFFCTGVFADKRTKKVLNPTHLSSITLILSRIDEKQAQIWFVDVGNSEMDIHSSEDAIQNMGLRIGAFVQVISKRRRSAGHGWCGQTFWKQAFRWFDSVWEWLIVGNVCVELWKKRRSSEYLFVLRWLQKETWVLRRAILGYTSDSAYVLSRICRRREDQRIRYRTCDPEKKHESWCMPLSRRCGSSYAIA